MRLQQIDIVGFKSFRDRATIRLSEGMTAIVGPNGCGKSNVVDAIKWAMGDMSAKSLRGQEMQDVIFAGSETAKPMGYAEVTLTFENSGFSDEVDLGDGIPREFRDVSEIAVTRRLHRSGESEYLINKVACRLLDIQNLLAGTGLGKQGYSIIEQNRVGFIVSSKPSERRLLIEEASGITRYKGQRDRSVRRLSKAEENLLRVNDILGEVEKQLRGLERQARRAAQHRRFTDELRDLEMGVLLTRHDALSGQLGILQGQVEAANQAFEFARADLSKSEGALTNARVETMAADKKNAATTEAFYRAQTQASLSQNQREHADSSLEELRKRLLDREQDETSQLERRQRLEMELETVIAALVEFEGRDDAGEFEVQEKELATLKALADSAGHAFQAHRADHERIRAEYFRAEDRRNWLQEQLKDLAERETEAEAQRAAMESEVSTWKARVDTVGQRLVKAAAALEERRQTFRAAQEKSSECRKFYEDDRIAFESLRKRDLRLSTEIETLEGLRDRGEGFGDSVKLIMEWARENARDDVLGPIADVAEGTPEEMRLLAQVLGPSLSDVVVRSASAAESAFQATGSEARVAFWVVPGAVKAAEILGKIERVQELADVGPSMGSTWLVDSGLVVQYPQVFAGQEMGEAAAALDRNMRLDELRIEREGVTEAATTGREQMARSELGLQEAIRAEAACKAAIEDLTVDHRSAQREMEGDQRELERAEAGLRRLQGQLVPLFKRQSDIREELERLVELQAENSDRLDRLKEGLNAKESAAVQANRIFEERRLTMTEKRVELAQRAERRRSLQEAKERVERGIQSADALMARSVNERAEIERRILDVTANAKASQEAIVIAERNLSICREAMTASGVVAEKAQQAVRQLELQVRDLRVQMEDRQRALQAAEVQRRETEIKLANCVSDFESRFELESIDAARPLCEAIVIPPDEWTSRRDYLKSRLESMGPVNAMAEQEYEESVERQAFLSEQRDDLHRSISDLRRAIAEMDRESRRRFKETFEAVDAKFQEVFPRLFRGGQARLLLTDPDDLLNTGVDIEVRPPGKKLQNVMLLSGGEKALTAVSLIFSIFMLKPTPFSILDEVDAPLDEANVGRFAQIVHEMSATSQMVVITHSRRTMESADVLYGVTMEQPGVSKLVSVRLSEVDGRLAS